MMNNALRTIVLAAAVLSSIALPVTHQVQAAPTTPRCHSGELYVAPVPNSGRGAAGHASILLQVRSFAQHACYVDGYPGVQLVDKSARYLPTHLQWGGGWGPGKKLITLQTGQSVYFGLLWARIPTGNEPCPTAYNLLVTPPDEKVSIVVPVSGIDACGGRISATALATHIPN